MHATFSFSFFQILVNLRLLPPSPAILNSTFVTLDFIRTINEIESVFYCFENSIIQNMGRASWASAEVRGNARLTHANHQKIALQYLIGFRGALRSIIIDLLPHTLFIVYEDYRLLFEKGAFSVSQIVNCFVLLCCYRLNVSCWFI